MSSILKWFGYIGISVGIIITLYLFFGLKVFYIDSFTEEAHPLRWLYGGLVLFTTVPVGLCSIALSNIYDKYMTSGDISSDYKYSSRERAKAISESQ